ncbi:hypothetical protein ABIB49_001415 [Arthrobacter sp. UYCu512]
MTSSINSPGKSALRRCVLLMVGGLLLSSCTAGPVTGSGATASGDAGRPPPSPAGTSDVGPGTEPTTHDGRTVLPARPEDCSSPGVVGIRGVLGTVADQLQLPIAKVSSKAGLADVTCTFALAPIPGGQVPEPGNSLLIATTTANDEVAFKKLELPRLMMEPKPVSGLGSKAWYSLNRLSDSTEYVLEVVDGLTVTRISLAVPAAAAQVDGMQQKLSAVAALP